MPLPESRTAVMACERCCKAIGTNTRQVSHLVSAHKGGQQYECPLPIDDEDDFLSDVIPCARKCGVLYCSAECQSADQPVHSILCKCADKSKRPWHTRFEAHAMETNETFLFGARVVATALAHGRGQFASLCRAPFWEISDEGCAKTPAEIRDAKAEAAESLRLLRNALAVSAADIEWLTLDAWGGLLGAARRNSICTELSHPLTELVPALHDWLEQSSKQGDDANRRAARQLLENDLPDPLPEMLFTALYSKVSWCNHSCKPNAEVHFFNESDEASLIATRDIESGEEVFISYIDGNDRWNVKERRASLADYGFTCDCIKCEQESGWQRRLRPRLV